MYPREKKPSRYLQGKDVFAEKMWRFETRTKRLMSIALANSRCRVSLSLQGKAQVAGQVEMFKQTHLFRAGLSGKKGVSLVSSCTSQSAGVNIGCHPFKGPGDDRMYLKTVQLSDMFCFDTTWSSMQRQTRCCFLCRQCIQERRSLRGICRERMYLPRRCDVLRHEQKDWCP